MSYAYEAYLSPIDLPFGDLLDRLNNVFMETGIQFGEQVFKLVSRDGMPMVSDLAGVSVGSMSDIKTLAEKWWGVSLYCVSTSIADALGRSDAMEVYFNVFKQSPGRYRLVYNESSAAFRARSESASLTGDLIGCLTCLCKAMNADFAIYEEELEGPPSLQDRQSFVQRVSEFTSATRKLPWLGVASQQQIGLDEAKALSSSETGEIRLSTMGFVVFQCLATS